MTLKRKVKKIISSVYSFCIEKGIFTLQEKGFRVLLYHSVSDEVKDDKLGIRIKTGDFYQQMKLLNDEGYNIFNLKELCKLMSQELPIPPKTVAITFDDGYKDIIENAVPILNKFGFPATIFITVDYMEGQPHISKNYWEKWKYLSMTDIMQLRNTTITIGSHSLSHPDLTKITPEKAEEEILGSKNKLEDILGRTVDIFSYPHGAINPEIKSLVARAGYVAACSSLMGVNTYDMDFLKLKRTEINADDKIHEFHKKLTGCYDWVNISRN